MTSPQHGIELRHQFLQSTVDAADDYKILATQDYEFYTRVKKWFEEGNTTVTTSFPYRSGAIDNDYLVALRALPQGKDRRWFASLVRRVLWQHYAQSFGQDYNHADAGILVYGSVAPPPVPQEKLSVLDKAIAQLASEHDSSSVPSRILKDALRDIEAPPLKLSSIYADDAPRIEEAINDLQDEVSVLDDLGMATTADLSALEKRVLALEAGSKVDVVVVDSITKLSETMLRERMQANSAIESMQAEAVLEGIRMKAEAEATDLRMDTIFGPKHGDMPSMINADMLIEMSELMRNETTDITELPFGHSAQLFTSSTEEELTPHRENIDMSQIHSLQDVASTTVTLVHGRLPESYSRDNLEQMIYNAQSKQDRLKRLVDAGSKSASAEVEQLKEDIQVYLGLLDAEHNEKVAAEEAAKPATKAKKAK